MLSRNRWLDGTLIVPLMLIAGLLAFGLTAAAQGNSNVRKAQQELQDKGYYHGNIDGLMGPKTHSALRQYQQSQDLPVTGNLDNKTAAGLGVSPVRTRAHTKPVEAGNMKAAEKSVQKGGKEFGHSMKKGQPIKATGELGKSIGHAGKEVGKAAKKAVKP